MLGSVLENSDVTPQNFQFPWGSLGPIQYTVFKPTPVNIRSDISIGSAVFYTAHAVVTINQPTKMHRNRLHLYVVYAIQPKNGNNLRSSVAVAPSSPSAPGIIVVVPVVPWIAVTPTPPIPAIPTAIVVPSIAVRVVISCASVVVHSVAVLYFSVMTANSKQTTIATNVLTYYLMFFV